MVYTYMFIIYNIYIHIYIYIYSQIYKEKYKKTKIIQNYMIAGYQYTGECLGH